MTDAPKPTDADKESVPPKPPGLPSDEELARRGWRRIRYNGKSYGLPLRGPIPKK